MSSDESINTTVATLVDSLKNLTKSGAIEKLPLISRSLSAEFHLEQVDKYIKYINASSSSDKSFILWQSLTDDIKNEIIFDSNYENNCNDFTWLCNKLKEMLPRKKNKTSVLLELNELKQHGQKASEFASIIKQELAKRRYLFDQNERDSLSLKLFLSGLDDLHLTTAIKQQKPKSIDEALKLLNSIHVKDADQGTCRLANNVSPCNCASEIKLLHGKLEYLQQLIIGYQRSLMQHSNKYRQKQPFQNNSGRRTYENQYRNRPPNHLL